VGQPVEGRHAGRDVGGLRGAAGDALGDALELVPGQAEVRERVLEQRDVGVGAVQHRHQRVAESHAGGLGAEQRLAAVVGRDGADDALGRAGGGSQDAAGGGVVDAELQPLVQGAQGAAGMLAGDRVGLVLPEGQRHHQLAEVVQQAGQVAVARRAAGDGGDGGAGAGDGQRVQVHLPAHDRAVAGHRLQEAVGAGLQRDLADAQPADHDHGLADALRLQRARGGGGVDVAQQVGGERAVRLDRGDDVPGRRLRIVGQRDHARNRAGEDGERPEPSDGGLDARTRQVAWRRGSDRHE
jgi:hypothetical protein